MCQMICKRCIVNISQEALIEVFVEYIKKIIRGVMLNIVKKYWFDRGVILNILKQLET